MDLASAAKLRNILLYGIQLHQSKVSSLPSSCYSLISSESDLRVPVLWIHVQERPNKTECEMSPCNVLSCFSASGEVAVFVSVWALLGRCVFFVCVSGGKKCPPSLTERARCQLFTFCHVWCAVLFHLYVRRMKRMQTCFICEAQSGSSTARADRSSTLKPCVMGVHGKARQVCAGCIRVDVVDLKSVTDCSVITGLYKMELFIQHREKCQDSCYQSRQVESRFFGHMCRAKTLDKC